MGKRYFFRLSVLSFILVVLLAACSSPVGNQAANTANAPEAKNLETVKLGYAKCAHCVSMSIVPELTNEVKVDAINFNSGNDVMTALVSKSIDIAQITYLHYVTALDKGFDVVAVSGQVNGGSDIIVGNAVDLKPDDWEGFKKLVQERLESGNKLKIAASRGNAQDIHLRGELLLNGIDPVNDVEIINIPNPSDHAAALQRGEVDAVSTVEPFASQIVLSGVGKHFAYPYKQAAGNLTNLIVTRSDVIKNKPDQVQAVVNAVVKLVGDLKKDQTEWVKSINKITGLDANIAKASLKNAYPDYNMYYKQTLAIASMMKDLQYISADVSDKVGKNMDYSFLEKATGKSKNELGYQ
ncbi:ABC transporter substrate-binding protein [Thermicanus aegyptius]|uniref:ABC transporter substrate-binding protein n=1 Tax=Thermicanus aegyptius TaxID=94009 RepID=UPI0003FC6E6C|nr:ABC transporter substrate-binding protein [Thermicanus aegyptius]